MGVHTYSISLAVTALATLVTASPLVKRSYPAPGACSGFCQGDVHDPNVVRTSDGTYYRFTTNDKINIATAPSITGPWTLQGPMLPDCSSIQLDGNCDLWAPDVSPVGDTWYAYYAVSSSGSQDSDIGLATSTSLNSGTWTDHGSIGIPANSDYNKIDPNLFQHDPNSPYYLTFGSFWNGIFQIEMSNPPTTVANTQTTRLITVRVSYDAYRHQQANVSQNTTARPDGLPGDPTEGSYQFWQPIGGTDYYFMFWSEGNCCNTASDLAPPGEEYHINVCRSTSPTGGFVDQTGRDCTNDNGGTLVLASHDNIYAPGGEGVMYDPGQNSVVIYYHYVDTNVGYAYNQFQFGWNKLDFSSGWPVVVS